MRLPDLRSAVDAAVELVRPTFTSVAGTVLAVGVLTRSGVVRPVRPDRLLGMAGGVLRYGFTMTSGYAAGAARHPDRTAILDDAGRVTFGEVHARTDRLAAGLADTGIGAGSRVGILCRNSRSPVEAQVALGKIGADAVLLNTGLSPDRLAAVARELALHTVIADAEFTDLLSGLPAGCGRITAWGAGRVSLEELIEHGGDTPLPLRPPPSRTIVLTSGTTGTPKGARRPQVRSLSPAAAVLSTVPLRAGRAMHVAAPLLHTWGNSALLLALLHGSPVVLSRRFTPEGFLRGVEEHRCDAVFAVPVMLQRVLELPAERLDAAWRTHRPRVVAVSGSALPGGLSTAFMDRFGDVLYNLYGSTEVSWVSIATPADLRASPGTAGRVPLGTRVLILDEDGRPVPRGGEGRVFVGNEMPFEGYTREDARVEQHGRLLGTGDVGRLDDRGLLHLTGRADDMIVSGGENVHPGPVEELLSARPEVREAAVVGVPDAEYGQRLAAYVVPAPGLEIDPDAVRAWVRAGAGRFAVPRDVVFVDALPRNATGKIVHRALRRE